MLTITFQIPPPLNSSGVVLIRVQISASLSFQVCRAEFRLSTIQFPLPNYFTSSSGRNPFRSVSAWRRKLRSIPLPLLSHPQPLRWVAGGYFFTFLFISR